MRGKPLTCRQVTPLFKGLRPEQVRDLIDVEKKRLLTSQRLTAPRKSKTRRTASHNSFLSAAQFFDELILPGFDQFRHGHDELLL